MWIEVLNHYTHRSICIDTRRPMTQKRATTIRWRLQVTSATAGNCDILGDSGYLPRTEQEQDVYDMVRLRAELAYTQPDAYLEALAAEPETRNPYPPCTYDELYWNIGRIENDIRKRVGFRMPKEEQAKNTSRNRLGRPRFWQTLLSQNENS